MRADFHHDLTLKLFKQSCDRLTTKPTGQEYMDLVKISNPSNKYFEKHVRLMTIDESGKYSLEGLNMSFKTTKDFF